MLLLNISWLLLRIQLEMAFCQFSPLLPTSKGFSLATTAKPRQKAEDITLFHIDTIWFVLSPLGRICLSSGTGEAANQSELQTIPQP